MAAHWARNRDHEPPRGARIRAHRIAPTPKSDVEIHDQTVSDFTTKANPDDAEETWLDADDLAQVRARLRASSTNWR